ncbi:Thioredoxin O1, mitochondrial [Linum grandiflorum]
MQEKSQSERMKWNSVIGPILRREASNFLARSSPSILRESLTSLADLISSPSVPMFVGNPSFATAASTTSAAFHVSTPLQFNRSFSSSAGACPCSTNVVPIKTEEEYNSSMKNIHDKSLPAIYYFTAVWCGPCKFISPVITRLSEEYPHVPTYKIDIDEPTLHFYKNGKKAAEINGVDLALLKKTMEELYGKE